MLSGYFTSSCNYLSIVAILSFLAVLSKVQGIMLIPIIVVNEIFIWTCYQNHANQPSLFKRIINQLPWKRLVIYISILLFLLYGRLWIMDFRQPTFQEGDNPTAFLSTWYLRLFHYNYLYGLNLLILLFPSWLDSEALLIITIFAFACAHLM